MEALTSFSTKKPYSFKSVLSILFTYTLLVATTHSDHASAANGADSHTVQLTTKIWPPYHYFDEKTGELTGKSVSVLKCTFEQLNVPFEIDVMPWARAQLMVKNNQADGFFSASWNATRDIYAVRSNDIAPQNWAWYSLHDNAIQPEHQSFKSEAKIGATIGSNIANWLDKQAYNLSSKSPVSEHLIKMLLGQRFDAFMGNELVIDNLLKNHKDKHLIKKTIERSMPVGVYFSKEFLENKPDFMDKFNQSIVSCR